MSRRIHGLFLSLEFPAGIAPGEGGEYNTLTIARNGAGRPVLRGTALAGALRHACTRHLLREGMQGAKLDERVKSFFGYALGDDERAGGEESRLQVSDCVLELGEVSSGKVPIRTHHLRNRHTGTVADGGLFSLEACPPGTRTKAALWLRDDDTADEGRRFLATLLGLIQRGLALGGKTARGLGWVSLDGQPVYREYDLTAPDGYADWLDDHRAWRSGAADRPSGETLHAAPAAGADVLQITLVLGIPRGQDLLVGDGQGLDHEIEPQRVQGADGAWYWRIPGGSLRGAFRAWIARLAARDGTRGQVADNVPRHVNRERRVWRGELVPETEVFSGDNLGWCFLPKADRRSGQARSECPVAALFGSVFQAGRIFISDAYARCSDSGPDAGRPEEQLRKHVAVDRITGGAAESMLFDNTVLTALPDGRSPQFKFTLRVQDARDHEAEWLAKAVGALDLGLIRIGSSKSSGRLALVVPPIAQGPGSEHFTALRGSQR